MSTYDDASLVLIPSGYKNGIVFSQKPMDANGQLTFTRASSATRVQSDGLIEKVRTNLVLQSNQFDTTWTQTGVTLTSGQVGYNGTNNAWSLIATATTSAHRIFQVVSTPNNISATYSVFAKANGYNFLRLRETSTTAYNAIFNLSTGVVVSNTGARASIENVGDGWYRCNFTISPHLGANGFEIGAQEDSTNVSFLGNGTSGILIQNSQMEVSDFGATDYIPTTTAAVSVGPVSGLPRLDYLNSTCPRLLLEPQRTNLFTFSEQFDNAVWSKGATTITANAAVSPDGYTNADKLISNAVSGFHSLSFSVGSKLASTAYSFSFYAKAGEIGYCLPNFNSSLSGTQLAALVNLTTGAVTDVSAGLTATTQNVGNGWYRVVLTATSAANTSAFIATINTTNAAGSLNFTGDGTSGVFIYGAQLEVGAYATSYIPTLSASVTRVADAASKTGITSLIGQTEGTMFLDLQISANASRALSSIDIGTTTNYIAATTNATSQVRVAVGQAGSATNIITSSALTLGSHKLAIAYKSGDYALYIDGVQAGVSASTLYPVGTLTQFVLNNASYGNLGDGYSQALLFKTRLDNATLQSLTTL